MSHSILQGKVSWIEGYGAFVEIALSDGRTASGLIHKSELAWNTVSVPEAVVSVGATSTTACAFVFLVSNRSSFDISCDVSPSVCLRQ